MPSTQHPWLVTWTARKMTFDGFIVAGFRWSSAHGLVWNSFPRRFEIKGARPDVWAIDCGGAVAVGEAKTIDDIDNGHTRHQLCVYRRLRRRKQQSLGRVYVAVPRSGVLALDRALVDVRMIRAPNLVRMHIPNCLVETELHDCT